MPAAWSGDDARAVSMMECRVCKSDKNESEFYRNGSSLRKECKPCFRVIQSDRVQIPSVRAEKLEKMRAYHKTEAFKEAKRRYRMSEKGAQSKSRRRTIILESASHDWSLKSWYDCMMWFDLRCVYCKKRPQKLTADHFIPVVSPKFPGTIRSNIVPACASCNSSKREKDPFEWANRDVLDEILAYFGEVNG